MIDDDDDDIADVRVCMLGYVAFQSHFTVAD